MSRLLQYLCIVTFIGLPAFPAQAQPDESYYNAIDWMPQYYSGPYHSDPAPNLSFYSESSTIGGTEPSYGYPMRSGLQFGLSDTVMLWVTLTNSTLSPITISGTPSQWFTPVLFDFEVDPHVVYPIADSSDLDWKFIGWQTYGTSVNITQPASIASGTQYNLVYYVWGLPVGNTRLQVRKTSNAPSTLVNLIGFGGDVWVTQPQQMADTLNAFAACYWRAYLNHSSQTNQMRWVDSILVKNPKSLVGYQLKQSTFSAFSDSIGTLAAFDSLLAISNSYRDPVMSDTTKFTGWHWAWYRDLITQNTYYRNKLISGNWRMIEQ